MMNESKHTQGPWSFDGCAISVPGMDLARVYHPVQLNGNTFNANGRLIAAAPTMYEFIEARASAGDEEAASILETINGRA